MFIHDMTDEECGCALRRAAVGRLACARGNQPYVVPIYFAYDQHYLYAISTMGQKIEWMRANPLVCVEVDNITNYDDWISVVVFGRYEELPDIPGLKPLRERALQLLEKRSAWWWEPACTFADHRDKPHSCTPVAFRIREERVSGLHAIPDPVQNKQPHGHELKPGKRKWYANVLDSVLRHRETRGASNDSD